MPVYPKFIIETDTNSSDCLFISRVNYHKELVSNIKNVKGGGWWTLNEKTRTFTLYGESLEFGRAKVKDIINCVKNNNIILDGSLSKINVTNYIFNYKDDLGEILNFSTPDQIDF